MGTQISKCESEPNPRQSLWRSTRNRFRRKPEARDNDFIVQFTHRFYSNHITKNIELLVEKRAVFVSLIGLFQTYQNCPPHVLYHALFLLPIKRNWIYDLNNNDPEFHHLLQVNVFRAEPQALLEFVRLLRWKDSQKLLFCMLDDYDIDPQHEGSTMHLIHPFWVHLSAKLSTLYDPLTTKNYNRLQFDKMVEGKTEYKFVAHKASVLAELYFLTMKFKYIQEIIFQSNATLNVITFYSKTEEDPFKRMPTCGLLADDGEIDEKEGEWFISVHYEP